MTTVRCILQLEVAARLPTPVTPGLSSRGARLTPHTGAAARLPRPAMRRSRRRRAARLPGTAWPARYRGMLLLAAAIAGSRLRTRLASGARPAPNGFLLGTGRMIVLYIDYEAN